MDGNSRKGFTLVELVVYMLLSAIVLVTAGSILVSGNNLFNDDRTRSLAKQVGDGVYSYIGEQLTYGSGVEIHSDGSGAGVNSITVTHGKLMVDGENVMGDEYYRDFTVEFFAWVDPSLSVAKGNYSVQLQVNVYDNRGELRHTAQSTVDVLNDRLNSLVIIDTAAKQVNPTITYTRGKTP